MSEPKICLIGICSKPVAEDQRFCPSHLCVCGHGQHRHIAGAAGCYYRRDCLCPYFTALDQEDTPCDF